MRPRLRFTRNQRIRSRGEFGAVFRGRCSVGTDHIVVYARKNDAQCARLGISIGRRAGNAVIRNREKRRLREAFRHLQHQLPHLDFVVVIKRPAQDGHYYADQLPKLVHRLEQKLSRQNATRSGRRQPQ